MAAGSPGGWGLVVPLAPLERAKSRLSAFGPAARSALALAFAGDLLDAAVACPSVRWVLLVTRDAHAAAHLAGTGVQVVADEPPGGLNAALAHGARRLAADAPGLGVAALTADLPALRPEHLAAALAAAEASGGRRAVVADSSGAGTTLLTALAGADLAPAYGPGSYARHVAAGARPLPAADGLRRDVDTPDDLAAALALGAGPRTRAAAARAGRSCA